MSLLERDLAGLAGTFLGDISPAARDALLAQASLIEAARGESPFADTTGEQRFAYVVKGTLRVFTTLPDGSQLTVRYARAGSMITTVTSTAVGAVRMAQRCVTPCILVELPPAGIRQLAMTDGTVAAATVSELIRRLEDVYRAFATTVGNTLRERVAGYLLDAAEVMPQAGLVAAVTHADLAESLRSAREVVSRVLRELKLQGIVSTGRGGIAILHPDRLVAVAGRWWSAGRGLAFDPGLPPAGAFDTSPRAAVGIDDSGTIVYANRSVQPIFGWEPGELLGRPISTLLPADTTIPEQAIFGSFMAEVRAGPIGLGSSLHGRRADGSLFPAEVTIYPVRSGAGQVVFATVLDVSYRKAIRDYFGRRAGEADEPSAVVHQSPRPTAHTS